MNVFRQESRLVEEILVVDDISANLILLSDMISSEGYSVLNTTSGEQAFQIAKENLPSIILLDIKMPVVDGFEVCRRLKADSVTSGIPIIFVSALDDLEAKLKGFELGGVDFITKPYRKAEVLIRVKTHIRLSQLMFQQKQHANELLAVNKQLKEEIRRREQADNALKNSEERYNAFVDANEDMIFLKDDQFRYLVVNDAMAVFFGKTKDEMLNKTDSELADEKIIFPCGSSDQRLLESDSAFIIEEQLGEHFCETTKFPVKLKGNKKGIGGIIRNITEQKKIATELKESEEKFRNLADSSPAAIGIYQDDYWVYVNRSTVEMSGYSLEELYRMRFWEIVSPDYQELILKNGQERLAGSTTPKSYEFPVRVKSGALRWAYMTGSSITFKGRPAGIITIIDITEKKKAETDILEERVLLRTLIDNLPDPVYVKNRNGRKMLSNIADIKNMGAKNEAEVLGKSDLELFNSEMGHRGYEDDIILFESGEPVINREEISIDENGVKRWLLTSKIPLFDQDGNTTGLVGIGHDITEIKKANETIQKLSQSIEQSPSSIVITDLNGDIEYVNPKFTEITGYTAAEVIGNNPRILKSGETPDEYYKDIWDTISMGEIWRGEFHNRKKNGELYWEWATMTSIKNESGKITNYIAIKEDISLRKQMEADLIIAKNKAEESDRLKSAFLANMSHEIRTPLNSIIGFSELLSDTHFDIEQKDEFIQHIIDNGNSLLTIISDIMDFSKMEAGQITFREKTIPINKFLSGINEEYIHKFKSKELNLIFEIPNTDEEIFLYTDIDRLRQIFNNLISNALKFTSKGSVTVGYEIKDEMIHFHVRDTGIGIPVQYHDRIFVRFNQVESSNTRIYGGNGLGLAITRALVEKMDGKIWIESEPEKGSTFSFMLPVQKKYVEG